MTIKVALIDDSESFLQLTKKKLLELSRSQKVFNVEVTTYTSGTEFLNSPNSREVNLAVLDYNMPALDGVQISKIISDIHPNIKMCFLVGEVNHQILDSSSGSTAMYILSKNQRYVPVLFETIKSIYYQGNNQEIFKNLKSENKALKTRIRILTIITILLVILFIVKVV
jgi:two-component system NtrC family response regulator